MIDNRLTDIGKDIITRAIADGKQYPIQFTKIKIGDGYTKDSWNELTDLIQPVKELEIEVKKIDKDIITVKAMLSNQEIETGFFYRELGLFALDKVSGKEMLVSYGNAGDRAEYINDMNDATFKEKLITIIIKLENISEITVDVISGIYATQKNLDEVTTRLEDAIETKANQTEFKSHTGNTTLHITSTERTNWNDANEKKHVHTNKSVLDGITEPLVTAWNGAVTHISDTVKHITANERTNWNSAKTKADSAVQTIMINGVTQAKGNGTVNLPAYPSSISGNAETANKLKTARKIGNASFDGSADISLSQIGVAAASHTHQNYMNQNAEAFDNTKNFDTYTTAGHYSVRGCYNIVDLNGPDGAYYDGTLLVFTSKSQKGVDYDSVTQIYLSDYYKKIHYRMKEGTEGWWFGWYTIQDTVYTHPSYPSKSNGLYKIIVDGTGHVSATNAVTKADITNLGIASSDSAIFTNNISMGRKEGTIIGNKSVAIGYYTTASGEYSHAEGCYTEAIGTASHAEGYGTGSSKNTAYGKGSHAEGINTTAGAELLGKDSSLAAHAEGYQTCAIGDGSHAEGRDTITAGNYSHAEGYKCSTNSSSVCSHAEGHDTTVSAPYSHAEGNCTTALGVSSHAEGNYTSASNYASHTSGKHNKDMTAGGYESNKTGDVFVIGNGTSLSAKSNAFRVTYAGETYGLSAFQSSGADYAEYFEWLDGNTENEDRVGYFVTMEGNKIKKATSNEDYILGIVSAQPCIIGNSDEDWLGRWQHDEFGRFLKREVKTAVTEWKEVQVNSDKEDEEPIFELKEIETGEYVKGWDYVPNPDYDQDLQYIERKDRKEWSAVGMMGVLAVRDDGTCKVNGFCTVKEGGIATTTNDRNGYRVIERVTENIVKVVFR